ncbi:hypothetical protein KIN20_023999 [Parelaphostrongylus tenuis]|uniref:Uncharacterized protein n=1 Tax=Parelaphostrongylus tenuis TaxID=148309 RepID=A0AAD5QWG3_PARTN|nr:hypothetical protein KIN20_023999 [Parelaphostrongylus tenuis]
MLSSSEEKADDRRSRYGRFRGHENDEIRWSNIKAVRWMWYRGPAQSLQTVGDGTTSGLNCLSKLLKHPPTYHKHTIDSTVPSKYLNPPPRSLPFGSSAV